MLTTCANWCTFHVSKVSLFHPLWRQGCPKIGWLVVNMDETDQVVPLLVSNLIQRIVLALWIWQVSLTFYARYQHPYLVLWRCHQKHMWPSEDLEGRSTYHKLFHHFIYFQVLSHPRHSDMDSKPLLGECWFNLSGGPKPLPIRISSPGSIGNLYHGSCGRGGMAGVPVPSGNLGGFCRIRAANWRSSCFTINIINHKPIIMFDPQSSIIP